MGELLKVLLGFGLGSAIGGGGEGYTGGQKRLFRSQADIAELMHDIMKLRSLMTGPNVGPEGQLQGPMVDALRMALGSAYQSQNQPRQRLQAPGFNPFGAERAPQTFGAGQAPAFEPQIPRVGG